MTTREEKLARRRELARMRRAALPPSEQAEIAIFIDALRAWLGLEALYLKGRRSDVQRLRAVPEGVSPAVTLNLMRASPEVGR